VSSTVRVIDAGRRRAAWSLNAIISPVYCDIGLQSIVFERAGKHERHNERVIKLLAKDLSARFGRGFRHSNQYHIRAFYLAHREKVQTVSGLLVLQILACEPSLQLKIIGVSETLQGRNFSQRSTKRAVSQPPPRAL
jgi:hypothetical protein